MPFQLWTLSQWHEVWTCLGVALFTLHPQNYTGSLIMWFSKALVTLLDDDSNASRAAGKISAWKSRYSMDIHCGRTVLNFAICLELLHQHSRRNKRDCAANAYPMFLGTENIRSILITEHS
ncbi:hypothetical protein DFH29DRAFT_365056 [Suillus ampliporus]|nr:hypothetical protein DFH29DRAFT_365056 [Suillus ampliporus]